MFTEPDPHHIHQQMPVTILSRRFIANQIYVFLLSNVPDSFHLCPAIIIIHLLDELSLIHIPVVVLLIPLYSLYRFLLTFQNLLNNSPGTSFI
jgi:hypothetical protein